MHEPTPGYDDWKLASPFESEPTLQEFEDYLDWLDNNPSDPIEDYDREGDR